MTHPHWYREDFERRNSNIMLIKAYAAWAQQKAEEGWDAYIISFMFHHLGGGPDARVQQMLKEVERVYERSITRIVRYPRAKRQADNLPIWIACPDFPVPKHAKQLLRDVTINDGLHIHASALLPNESRLRTGLDQYFQDHQNLYVRPGYPLRRVSALIVEHSPDYVTEYAMKALRRGRSCGDDILILPRPASDMRQKPTAMNPTLGKRLVRG